MTDPGPVQYPYAHHWAGWYLALHPAHRRDAIFCGLDAPEPIPRGLAVSGPTFGWQEHDYTLRGGEL